MSEQMLHVPGDHSSEADAIPPAESPEALENGFAAKTSAEAATTTDQRLAQHHHHPVGFLPAVQSLLYVLIVALFLTTFTVQPIRIPSGSMEPTLLVGDFLLLDRQVVSDDNLLLMPPTGVKRGDVVVFHDPVDDPSVHLVKRVIGLPGDRIFLRGNRVFVNGHPLKEPYAVYRASVPDGYRDEFPNLSTMDARVDPAWWIRLRSLVRNGEITVPAGDYFVLGDNRNESDDSRYWGFVPRNDIVGDPVMVYFSYRQPDGQSQRGWKAFARWDRMFHRVR
jgi:signal peptidase I